MIRASIDIGTNTVLLLVAELKEGKIYPLEEKQRIPRLGKGVDKEKNLQADSIQRVLNNLKEYKNFLDEKYPDVSPKTVVTATSAVRDASNRVDFIHAVKKVTAWDVRLLSGPEEAETTYRGALSVLEERSDKANLVLDIGGGSTELAFGSGYKLKRAVSIDMGSVRFTERFFENDPPNNGQMNRAESEIRKLLSDQRKPEGEFDLIGVAGTITSIAAIELGLTDYEVNKLNGFSMNKKAVDQFIEEFSKISSQEIEVKYPRFLKGRGEVVLAGMLILKKVMEWCGKDSIITSTGGIRHGILLNH